MLSFQLWENWVLSHSIWPSVLSMVQLSFKVTFEHVLHRMCSGHVSHLAKKGILLTYVLLQLYHKGLHLHGHVSCGLRMHLMYTVHPRGVLHPLQARANVTLDLICTILLVYTVQLNSKVTFACVPDVFTHILDASRTGSRCVLVWQKRA